MTEHYNSEARELRRLREAGGGPAKGEKIDPYVDQDPTQISWTRSLKDGAFRGREIALDSAKLTVGAYRPFVRQALYFDRSLNEMIYQQPRFFPQATIKNPGIVVISPSVRTPFSTLMVDNIPDLGFFVDPVQFFPRYRHGDGTTEDGSLFSGESPLGRIDNISDDALAEFRTQVGPEISKDDIFNYTYGLLHSPEYRQRFTADLSKVLPRIPKVESFQAFVDAGRQLASLHLEYESVRPFPVMEIRSGGAQDVSDIYRVNKMTFAGAPGKGKDRSTIVYNHHISLSGIPLEAYRYQLGSRSAIEWVMDRYQVRMDKASGITNDPNDWCDEVGDPRDILDLVKRVVTVSIDTMRIVDGLPPLDIVG